MARTRSISKTIAKHHVTHTAEGHHTTHPTFVMMLCVALAATALAAPRIAGRPPTSEDLDAMNYEYTFETYAAVSTHPSLFTLSTLPHEMLQRYGQERVCEQHRARVACVGGCVQGAMPRLTELHRFCSSVLF